MKKKKPKENRKRNQIFNVKSLKTETSFYLTNNSSVLVFKLSNFLMSCIEFSIQRSEYVEKAVS